MIPVLKKEIEKKEQKKKEQKKNSIKGNIKEKHLNYKNVMIEEKKIHMTLLTYIWYQLCDTRGRA